MPVFESWTRLISDKDKTLKPLDERLLRAFCILSQRSLGRIRDEKQAKPSRIVDASGPCTGIAGASQGRPGGISRIP